MWTIPLKTFVDFGRQDSSDPNWRIFVDPDALSGLAEIEYDYSHLYEDDDDDEPTRADKATESNLTKDQGPRIFEDAVVSDLTKDTQPVKDACVVRNMTCARLPSRKHCKGFAIGRLLRHIFPTYS